MSWFLTNFDKLIKIWSWFLTNVIIYRWLPCERPLCVGPLNFWEFGKFSRNFIWSCLYKSPCCVVTCNAAFVLFSPTLYSGKLARIWSCTAGFDVITYALVKKFFHCCAYLTFWRLWYFFCLMRPLSKVETRRNCSFATVWSMDLYQCRQFFRVCDCIKIWSWFLTNVIIYRWLPCERPLCVGPQNFWEFGKFSRNFNYPVCNTFELHWLSQNVSKVTNLHFPKY